MGPAANDARKERRYIQSDCTVFQNNEGSSPKVVRIRTKEAVTLKTLLAVRIVLVFFTSLLSGAFCLVAQNISTIAGGGPKYLSALQVGLAQPSGIAVDSSGNVYVALAEIHQIWKINTSQQVTVFAGNGSFPFNSDGILATSATLNQPRGMVFDTAGNLYFADSAHNRVRKIAASGIINTVAGTGVAGFSGDAGAATLAQLNNPVAVALDSANNLYIVDKNNVRVRVISPSGTINTFAGNGTAAFAGDGGLPVSASLNTPTGVATATNGAVYISELNHRVRVVSGGTINTFAGNNNFGYAGDGGQAGVSTLNTVQNVATDSSNNVYIVESFDVRKVNAGSGVITTIAGGTNAGYLGDGGSPSAAQFSVINSIAFDSTATNIYLVDSGNARIRKVTATTVSTYVGNGTVNLNGDGQVATNANILTPGYVAVDNAGSLLFSDSESTSIRKVTLATGLLSTLAGNGLPGLTSDNAAASGYTFKPSGYQFDSAGSVYFVEQNRVRKLAAGVITTIANSANTPGFSGDGGLATAAQLQFPAALARAVNGDLYVADSFNNRVRLISASTGVISTVVGTGTASSTGDNGLGVNAAVNYPSSLSLDGAGNLFIGEFLGNRVRKLVLSSNIITTVAGDGTTNFADGVAATSTGLSSLSGIFADQSDNLFLADQGHSRVRRVASSTGLISTVAGNGTYDFNGDGAAATAGAVNPLGVTVDRSQNLYIADSSGRIRTTTVTACFFTFATPTIYVSQSAASKSIAVTASNPSCTYSVSSSSPFLTITSGASGTGSGTIIFAVTADAGQSRTATVSVGGASFSVTQAGTFGQTNIGFARPDAPLYVLDSNGNGTADAGDKVFSFTGQAGAIAVTGDWNGDGRTKVGFYLNGFWVLDYDGNGVYDSNDKFYGYGGAGYIPVVGDWNGDGRTKIGFFHDGFWVLDLNGNGQYDDGEQFGFGLSMGEVPIVGDWNGDKRTKVGFYSNGLFVLDYDGNRSFNVATDKYYTGFASYIAGDKPVVGDWNGNGKAKIGLYRGGFWVLDYNGNGTYDGVGTGGDKFYGFGGNAGEVPLIGDWSGSGTSKIGVYINGFFLLDFDGNGSFDVNLDRFAPYGGSGNQPIVGRW